MDDININNSTFEVSVKGLYFNDENKLLMIQEESGEWEVPGGRIQKGEDLLDCLTRECFEETELECEVLDSRPLFSYSAIDVRGMPRLMIFYKINFNNLDFKPSPECVALKFFSKDEIKNLETFPQLKKLPDFL